MRLGEILVARGLVTIADIDEALARQQVRGGRLGDNLIALGRLTEGQIAAVIDSAPAVPAAMTDTGIAPRNLLNLLLKFMHLEGVETVTDLIEQMKLPHRVVQQLLDDGVRQKFIQAVGAVPGNAAFSVRYSLSEQGKAAARDALDQTLYLGPAPVCLMDYQQQILTQRITNEMLDEDALRSGFGGLVVSDHYLRKLLPAINAGRTILLFGPPGNGKTTLATRIAKLFHDVVYIPYAVEIGGLIVKIYDPALHVSAVSEADAAALAGKGGLQREGFDERWVACKRPVAIAGGEFTLEMLDLQYNRDAKFYDAPLHMKALNGMLLVDDFGRQKFNPNDLLNRWIVPMENRVDYMKLHTGMSFSLPFDELLIFSTNLQPSDLMDPAFLRRIPYKIKLSGPTREEYRRIFDAAAKAQGLELVDDVVEFVIDRLTGNERFGLAYYQPKFICEQVVEACRCLRLAPAVTRELAAEALANLYFEIEDARDAEPPVELRVVAH